MKVKYYMVSLGLPYNHSKYFKSKSRKQIREYCKSKDMKVVYIFKPTAYAEKGKEYIDI